jgi:hypothetical protein
VSKRSIILILLSLLASLAEAQVLPRSGTNFTFGIPEGADFQGGSATPSTLLVNIVSEYDGKGIITSRSGYCQEFSFSANKVTVLTLPNFLMQLTDLGKTNKGILFRTTEPVNVTFHDFLTEAGEATQIYPDNALDTSYRITSWGLWNDPDDGENNHSQFLISAPYDGTDVTIVPSVLSLGNHQAGVPIHVTLNRGECYIVKADTSGVPLISSLTGSLVSSTKPVSIVTAITCAYNPLGVQSCDEILDEMLPRRITDTTFYVVPIIGPNEVNTILFTSESPTFWITSSTSVPFLGQNGRAQVNITTPDVFHLSAPAQCFLLTQGSSYASEGDPSIVPILPASQFVDTMLWFTPFFSDTFFSTPIPFDNFVSVAYPTASEAQVKLDGKAISSVSTPQQINGTGISGTIVPILPGVHRLIAPVALGAITGGFATADGYSFIPGTTSPYLPIDTLPAFLSIAATTAQTCRSFDATVTSVFHSTDSISSVDLTIKYDPYALTLTAASLGPAAQGGQWTIDSRIPGVIVYSATCLSPFADSDVVAKLSFFAGSAATTTTISARIDENGGDYQYTTLAGSVKKDISVLIARDTLMAAFSVDRSQALINSLDTATVRVISAPNEAIDSLDLFISYNHDLMSLIRADFTNSVLAGVGKVNPLPFNVTTDRIHIPLSSKQVLPAPGIFAKLIFTTYVTDSVSGSISVSPSLYNSRSCPLDILALPAGGEFTGTDTCGFALIRAGMKHLPLSINSIVPNPSQGTFIVSLERNVFGGDPVHLNLCDMLGHEVWNMDYLSSLVDQTVSCAIPPTVSSGPYFLRVSINGHVQTQKIVIQH